MNFGGKRVLVMCAEGPEAAIIDCYDPADEHKGFIFNSGESRYSMLAGVTIRNGKGTLAGYVTSGGYGGGICCTGASPCLVDVVVENCASTFIGFGGGVYCREGDAWIDRCIIRDNTSIGHGGGIYCEDSSMYVRDSVIEENIASFGGGICVADANPMFDGCTISSNSTSVSGGGVFVTGVAAPDFNNCWIMENAGPSGGAGCYFGTSGSSGNSDLVNCVLAGNMATTQTAASAVYSQGNTTLQLYHCTLAGNSNVHGGGCGISATRVLPR